MVWSDPSMGKSLNATLKEKDGLTVGQRRFEVIKLLEQAVPSLFVVGPPPMDGVSVRFGVNWSYGILCIYVPRELVSRIPSGILRRVDKAKIRFPNLIVKYVVYDEKFVWPERESRVK